MSQNRTKLKYQTYSRNYGIDALRIISMLMVVMLHVLKHGGIIRASESITYLIIWFLEVSAFCAVDCYALISGYVGVYSQYKISNLATLWCRVSFYSLTITAIFKILFPNEISNGSFFFSFFPIFSRQYWYFTSYALMFLFIPFINEGINRLSKRRLRVLLIAIITFTSFLKPFIDYFWGDIFVLNEGFSPWWLIILYMIGGYIRKYGVLQKLQSNRTVVFLGAYLAFVIITWGSKILIPYSANLFGREIISDECLFNYQSITILGSAVSLLLAFEHISFNASIIKVVSMISPFAFSVYLIHDHTLIRQRLIADNFTWIAQLPAYLIVPVIFGVVICIYFACSLLDVARYWLFKIVRIKERSREIELKIIRKIKSREDE